MPTTRKSNPKSKSKSEATMMIDTGKSRLDNLPPEIKDKIYRENYNYIYPLFLQHLTMKLNIQGYHSDIVYDYNKIIKKLKIKISDIKNFENIESKRNFKDFNKKISIFFDKYITPVINEYREIYDIIKRLSTSNIINHDFSYHFNKINIVESELVAHTNKLNKLLHILKLKFNSGLKPNAIIFINNGINKINKVTRKHIPLIKNTKNTTRHTRSFTLKHSKKNRKKNKEKNRETSRETSREKSKEKNRETRSI